MSEKRGIEDVIVSHGWWDRFHQRHPHLTLRAGVVTIIQAQCFWSNSVFPKLVSLKA